MNDKKCCFFYSAEKFVLPMTPEKRFVCTDV